MFSSKHGVVGIDRFRMARCVLGGLGGNGTMGVGAFGGLTVHSKAQGYYLLRRAIFANHDNFTDLEYRQQRKADICTTVHLSICHLQLHSILCTSPLYPPSTIASSAVKLHITWKLEPVDALRSVLPPPIQCVLQPQGGPGSLVQIRFALPCSIVQSMTPCARNS